MHVRQRADLRMMFNLFRLVDGGVHAMADMFRSHVEFEGQVLVQRRVSRCSAAVDEPSEGNARASMTYILVALYVHDCSCARLL